LLKTSMLIPSNIPYEIECAKRQSEAVAIFLKQHKDHPLAAKMLRNKMKSIENYIEYLETVLE